MNVIQFLMLLFSLYVFLRFFVKLLNYSHFKYLPPTSAKLSHHDILDRLTELNHPEFEGVCFGFTVNWSLAVTQGKEEFFYQQLRAIRKYQNNLASIIRLVMLKKMLGSTLSSEEQCIDTLPDLFKRICYAQSPSSYKELYGTFIWQADVDVILQTITPQPNKPSQVFYKTHTFSSRDNARDYFNELIRLGLGRKTAVMVSTANHSMGFKRTKQNWRFIDINDLFKQDKNRAYFTFDTNALVDHLYQRGADEFSPQRLAVSTDFIALHNSSLAQQLKPLEHQFPLILNEMKDTTYRDRRIYVALAAQQGDLTTVRDCVQAGWSMLSNRHKNANSPIFTAIQLGRRDVVRAMLSVIQHRINFKIKKNESTLLHEACRYPHKGIVEDLLNIPGIIIDSPDKNKRTPLMLVCRSRNTNDDPSILELLLNRKASLTLVDKEGLTALDHAEQYLNGRALQIIRSHAQETKAPSNEPSFSFSQAFGFFSRSTSPEDRGFYQNNHLKTSISMADNSSCQSL